MYFTLLNQKVTLLLCLLPVLAQAATPGTPSSASGTPCNDVVTVTMTKTRTRTFGTSRHRTQHHQHHHHSHTTSGSSADSTPTPKSSTNSQTVVAASSISVAGVSDPVAIVTAVPTSVSTSAQGGFTDQRTLAPSSSPMASTAVLLSTVTSVAAPETSSAVSGGGVTADQQETLLKLQNAERANYGAAPLAWSSELEAYALKYAAGCVWKHSGGPYGENLAASYGSDAITTGVQGWVSERSQYDYSNPTYSHWTQVVWKGTSKVGCALVSCPAGSIQQGWPETDYLVCEYQAAGNVQGQYTANIGTKV